MSEKDLGQTVERFLGEVGRIRRAELSLLDADVPKEVSDIPMEGVIEAFRRTKEHFENELRGTPEAAYVNALMQHYGYTPTLEEEVIESSVASEDVLFDYANVDHRMTSTLSELLDIPLYAGETDVLSVRATNAFKRTSFKYVGDLAIANWDVTGTAREDLGAAVYREVLTFLEKRGIDIYGGNNFTYEPPQDEAEQGTLVGPRILRERELDLFDTPVENMYSVTVRARNKLEREGIRGVGQLVTKTAEELRKIEGFGKKSLESVEDYLEQELGLNLGMMIGKGQQLHPNYHS